MDTQEYAEALLTRDQPPPPSEVLKAAEQLTVPYLRHLLVMHKYLQELINDSPFKRVQLLLMTRTIDGFVTGAHLLRARSYNASMTEMRTVFDALSLMKWLAVCEPALTLYLSNNTELILREFRASRVREYLGRTPHDHIYDFLLSYHTHPFYTGKEYLLGVDLSKPGNIPEPRHPHYPALDAVAAAIQLLTHAHTAYELATSFGLKEIVKKDRDRLGKMYQDIDHYLAWVSKKIGPHRTIQAVIYEFHRHFPVLYDARFRNQQGAMHRHFKLLQRSYGNGTIPFPAPYQPAHEARAMTLEESQVTRSVLPQGVAATRATASGSSATLPRAVGPMDATLPEMMDEPPPVPSGFGDLADDPDMPLPLPPRTASPPERPPATRPGRRRPPHAGNGHGNGHGSRV